MSIKCRKLTAVCGTCEVEFKYTPSRNYGKYCSSKCHGVSLRVESRRRFAQGEIKERSTNKVYVIERDGYFCAECNISEYNGKTISLQLDHIDGCAANNLPDNLRLLCPNCHSQTPHYGAKNKGKGRKSLGLPTR